MSVCRAFELCILYLYPLLLIVYLNYGYEILHRTLETLIGDSSIYINIEPDIFGTIIWILITLLPILYHVKGDNSNLFKSSLFILFIATITINVCSIAIQQEYMQSLLTSLLVSICVYKQFSLYQQINIQHSWFDGNHRKSNSSNSYSHGPYTKWIMYSLSNILIYLHSFIYFDGKCNLISVNTVLHRTWISIMPIPYYLLPSNLKYDLYFNKTQMVIFLMSQIFNQLWLVFYAFWGRYYVNDNLHTFIVCFLMLCWILALIALPTMLNKYKQKKFMKLLELPTNNHLRVSWSDYILLNNNNFQQFGVYLTDSMIYQHLLFMVEIMSYKHAVLRRLNNVEVNNGYLFVMTYNDIRLLDTSPIVNEIYELPVEQITIERIKIDMAILYEKYMQKYDANTDENEHNTLYLSFVSAANKALIRKNWKQINGFEVLNVFDNSMKEISSILQSLYREYAIQHT